MGILVRPYFPVFLDTSYEHIRHAVLQCAQRHNDGTRTRICKSLAKLWTSKSNHNFVMTFLSVRTGFDLFLQAKNFPPGSEVIMSGLNIPDMSLIVRSHNLVIVTLDINIDTLEPKIEHLTNLISSKTVAIVIAHLCGRLIDMGPLIKVTREHGIAVIEDCAQCFSGLDSLGHPEADITLFSFGAIKFCTSFGGCIAKIRDVSVYKTIGRIHCKYPVQSTQTYLRKILKCSMIYTLMQVEPFPQVCRAVLGRFGVDHRAKFINMMRGFPDQMLQKIRCQPSTPLLASMLYRCKTFSHSEFNLQRIKGDYFMSKLPAGYEPVGQRAMVNNFWLFPVLLDDPDTVIHMLNVLGVNAYRGATHQLNLVKAAGEDSRFLKGKNAQNGTRLNEYYPHEAKYLIDHIVYLPVNKWVPFHELDKMLKACQVALELSRLRDCKSLRTKHMLMRSNL